MKSCSSPLSAATSVVLIAMAASCSPKPEVRPEPSKGEAATPDSIVLERGVCFGFCPAYRLRIASNGAMHFEPQNPPGPAAIDSISPAAFAELARETERVNLGSYPDTIQSDKRLCAMRATDHPSAAIAVFSEGVVSKRIDDYTGCHAAPDDAESEARLQKLRAFEAFIDSVAGTSRWTSRNNNR